MLHFMSVNMLQIILTEYVTDYDKNNFPEFSIAFIADSFIRLC